MLAASQGSSASGCWAAGCCTSAKTCVQPCSRQAAGMTTSIKASTQLEPSTAAAARHLLGEPASRPDVLTGSLTLNLTAELWQRQRRRPAMRSCLEWQSVEDCTAALTGVAVRKGQSLWPGPAGKQQQSRGPWLDRRQQGLRVQVAGTAVLSQRSCQQAARSSARLSYRMIPAGKPHANTA